MCTGRPGAISFTLTETLTTGATGENIVAGDFTGDGIPDLMSGNGHASSTLSLFRGIGDGTFHAPTTVSGVSSRDDITAADLNDDDYLDLIVPHGLVARSGSVQVLLGLGDGTFGAPVDYDTGSGDWFAVGVVAGDYDGDGLLDLAVVNNGLNNPAGSLTLLWGLGTGAFTQGPRYPLQPNMIDVVSGNIDGDPALELLAVSGATYTVNVLDYVGNRQFQETASVQVRPGDPPGSENLYQAVLVDLDNDAHLDLAVVDPTSTGAALIVMPGNGDRTFQSSVEYPMAQPAEVQAGDVNGDSWVDLVVGDWQLGTRIYTNQGAGTFVAQPSLFVPTARDTVIQDFDGNGSLDFAVLREDGSNQVGVFLNQGPLGNPTLTLAAPDLTHAGAAFPVVVTVRDAAGNVRTDFTGTVRFKSSLAGAQLPPDYTFTPADAGSHTFLLTRATAGDETLSVHLASDLSRFDLAQAAVVALNTQGVDDGGGLRNAGTATLTRVEIADFAATKGGGVYNAGTLTLLESTAKANSAVRGGGVYNAGGLTLTNATITENTAGTDGGGIYNAPGAAATVSSSTISANEAIGIGQAYLPIGPNDSRLSLATSDNEDYPEVAGNGTGRAFVSYYSHSSNGTAGEALGIFYEAAPQGSGFYISPTNDSLIGARPRVAIDADGIILASYTGVQYGAPGTTTHQTAVRRYSSPGDNNSGSSAGPILINASSQSADPSIATNDAKQAVIVWHEYLSINNPQGGSRTAARLINSDTGFIGSSFAVGADSPAPWNAQSPDVAIDSQGNFVVVSAGKHAGDAQSYIYMSLYDSQGVAVPNKFDVRISALGQAANTPRVERNDDGFVVVWEYANQVTARRFDHSGNALGAEFALTTDVTTEQYFPRLTLLADGGFYAVWNSAGPNDTGSDIHGQQFDAQGNRVGPESRINLYTAGNQQTPSVAQLGPNTLLVAWDGLGENDSQGIFARILQLTNVAVGGDGGGVYNAGTLTATNVTISGNEAAGNGGGIYNTADGDVTVDNVTVTDNSALGNGATTALTSTGGEFLINTTTAGQQGTGDVAMDPTGRAVLTWGDVTQQLTLARFFNANGSPASPELQLHSGIGATAYVATMDDGRSLAAWYVFDGSGYGISGAVLSPSGGVITSVNPDTYISGNQVPWAVATDGHSRYVVVWQDDTRDGSNRGIFARLYDENGVPLGSDFIVNSTTSQQQQYANAAMWDDGAFVVAYWSIDGADWNVRARLFSASGTPLTTPNAGNDFILSASSSGQQASPKLAAHANGFVATWVSDGYIVARRFDRSGTPLGGDILVSDSIANPSWARVAMLPDDGFVVVWDINYGAGDSQECFAQRFAADGTRIGTAFRINTTTVGYQFDPRVATTAGGKVLVAWTGAGPGDAPDGEFGQRYQFTYSDAGGISNSSGGSVAIKNSIVANNTSAHIAVDVSGGFTSSGGNLIGDDSSSYGFTHATDQFGSVISPLDPQLGPLADNGGPTKTHLPAANSPALDAGVAAGAPATDQRGVARPQDGDNNGAAVVDIGAVERYYASISGKKFKDQNQNGVQDGGEPGLAGWTIFLDANQNGALDAGERSTVTDAQGNYSFPQLIPGQYTVADVNQTGWTRTYQPTRYQSEIGIDTQAALASADKLAMSPDGKFVYALINDGTGTIVTLSRNATTGALAYVGTVSAAGLSGGGNLVVSADGAHLYAVGTAGNGLLGYSRNLMTGQLTQIASLALTIAPVDLAMSSDGKSLYVLGGTGNGLRIYARTIATGTLSFLGSRAMTGAAIVVQPDLTDVEDNYVHVTSGNNLTTYSRNETSGLLGASPLFAFSNGQPASGGGIAAALSGVTDLAASPDGLFLYTLSSAETAVGVYQHDPATGELEFIETLARGAADSLGTIVDGLDGARSLVVSAAGDRVYVTGDSALLDNEEDSLAVFRRNATNGRLYFSDALKQFDADPAAPLGFYFTLGWPGGVVVSPSGGDVYVASRDGAITQFARDGQGLDRKTLLVGQELTGVDFSEYAAPSEIRGTVYNDADNDGVRDPTELGLAAVAVYLDADGDNQFDSGEPTTTTNATGGYAFTNLAAPANYTVRLNLPTNQTVTSPDAAAQRQWNIAPLNPNQTYIGADFLVNSQVAGVGAGTGQITGVVWRDDNKDGVRQGTEPFLAGRQVYFDVNDNGAYDIGVDVVATALTSATGNYSFNNLGVTIFVVRIVPLPGELTSTPVGNAFSKQSLATGANPVGLVSADFNGDGKPDLASVDAGSDRVSVRLQQTGGTFAAAAPYAVNSQPTGIAVGQFNNDAYPDIAVVHYSFSQSKVVFLINNGNGTFARAVAATELPIAAGHPTVAARDFDGDADDDLAVTLDGIADTVFILKNSNAAAPSFTQVQAIGVGTGAPLSIAVGDLTADGKPELLLGHFFGNSVQVLQNTSTAGNPSFAPLAAVTTNIGDGPSSLAIVPDLNADGFKDAVVATIGTNAAVKILLGNGAGLLTAQATAIPAGNGPRSIAAADVDGDGDLDFVVGNAASNDVVVLRRTGLGADLAFAFPESSGLASFASLAAVGVKQVLTLDLDGNNVLDVAAVRGDANSGSLAILSNALAPGSLRFALAANQTKSGQNFGVTSAAPAHPGDYDGDLDVDGTDFLVWQRTLGGSASPFGSGADGNADGTINAGDLTVWRNNFETVYSAAAAGAASSELASVASFSAASVAEVGSSSSPSPNTAADARDALFASGDFTALFQTIQPYRPAIKSRPRFAR